MAESASPEAQHQPPSSHSPGPGSFLFSNADWHSVPQAQLDQEFESLKDGLEVAMDSITHIKPDWSEVNELWAKFQAAVLSPTSRATTPALLATPTDSAPVAVVPSRDVLSSDCPHAVSIFVRAYSCRLSPHTQHRYHRHRFLPGS